MSSKKRKPAANEVLQRVENLFENKSVADIREVEGTTKRDIEDKKLQLRQLVGDSYRDLLESADKIVAISRNCELIVGNVLSIQESLSGLIHNISASSQGPADKHDPLRKHEELYAVGSRVKYLVDTPEMIWGCLDLQQYLGASRRFLRAQQVYNLLNKSFSTEMLARFPLLAHQWPQVLKFKKQIVDTVKQALVSSYEMNSKQVADALLAAAVLELHDSQGALQLLLDSRRAAVAQQLAQARDQADQAAVAKLLAGVAAMMQTCIFQVGELFLAPGKGGDSSCLLQRVAHEDEVDASELIFEGRRSGAVDGKTHEVEAWMQSNQALNDMLQPLTPGQVERACAAWVRDLEVDCGGLCVQLLGACTTAASLVEVEGAVRASVHAWLRPASDQAPGISRPSQRRKGDSSGQLGAGWEGVAEWVLGRPLHLWQEFFQLPFTTRAKQIIEAGFVAVRRGMEGPLKECMAKAAAAPPEAPGRVACPRWPQGLLPSSSAMPSTADPAAPTTPAAAPAAAPAETGPGSFRLAVQSIRRQFDQDLTRVMASAVLLLTDPGAGAEGDQRMARVASSFSPGGSSFSLGPGGLAARRDAVRASELEPFVQLKCGELVSEVAAWLQGRLTAVAQPAPGVAGAAAVESALLVGRLAAVLASESATLPLIMGHPDGWRAVGQPSSGAARMLAAASGYARAGRPAAANSGGSAKLQQLGEVLRGIALQAYRVWAGWAATGLAAELGSALFADEVLRCPSTPVSWVETVVAAPAGEVDGAEDPSGGIVTGMEMRFMLPAVASPAVSGFLAAACMEARRAGDHAAGMDALQLFAWELGGAGVQVLDKLLAPGADLDGLVSEKGTLQLLFDQRMLRDVLAGGRPLPARALEDPVARTVSLADPGQLDVAALSADRRRSWLSLQSLLTDRLDPIDWATYEPHLWAHVARCGQRSATLLGLLMQLQRSAADSGSASKLTAASAPSDGRPLNVMPVVPRFQFLPVSTPLHSHAQSAMQRAWSGATPAAQSASRQGGVGSDLAAAYSFTDLGSTTVSSQAAGAPGDGAGSSAAVEQSTSALGALQAKLQAGSLGSLGTMLGDKAAEMTAMAQQKWDIGLGDLGTGLLSSLAKNVGVRNPMQK